MADGSRDYVEDTDRIEWGTWSPASTTQITLACWVYLDTVRSATDARFISKSNTSAASGHEWMLGYTNNGGNAQIRARFARTDTVLANNDSTGWIPTGQWVHVAVAYNVNGSSEDPDGQDYIFYKNGVNIAQGAGLTASLQSSTWAVWVGNQVGSTSSAPDGRLTDVAVWSRKLTAAEILSLYEKTARPGDIANCEGWLKFDGSTDFADYSGNGRTATNNGTDFSSDSPGFGGASTVLLPVLRSRQQLALNSARQRFG